MNTSSSEPHHVDGEAPRRPRSSVRARLLVLFIGSLLLTGVSLLGVGAYTLVSTSSTQQKNLESALREGVESRGELLARNHASALQTMVADNAFSTVQDLVQGTVSLESGLVRGFFREPDGRVWVYAERGKEAEEEPDDEAWSRAAGKIVAPTAKPTKLTNVSEGELSNGEQVFIVRSSVFDAEEHLGDLVYVLSKAPIRKRLEETRLQTQRLTQRAGYLLAAVGLLSLVVAAGLVTRLARRLTLPLERLRASAQSVASGGEWKPVEVSSSDELELLADAFNHMVTQNAETMVELRQKTDDALAAARLKSEFLANMSHEIRTPMNGILGVSRLAQQRSLDGTMRRYIETINSSAQSLLTIINDVLDFSKLEAGKYTVTSCAFDLRATMTEVAQLHANRAQEKGVRLINRTDPDVARSLMGDPDRIRQILGNLLSNATKFTTRGEIVLEANLKGRGDERLLVISVKDTGAGISESNLAELFQAFHQVDGGLSRQHGGTGLGLAISRGLAEVMGGEISAESEEGQGSVFTLSLPYVVDEKASLANDDTWASGKRALVVEDHALWQQILRENLSAWGITVEMAESGSEAEEKLNLAEAANEAFDLLVMGSLQCLDVPQLLERADGGERAIAVIALCQPGEEDDADVVRERGSVLPKPLHVSELYNTIQSCFTGSENRSSSGLRCAALQSSLPVLVVDDNEINRFVATEQLAELGLESETAENGLIAFNKVKETQYLAVLMDCQMPVMDGYTATRTIRQWENDEGKTPTLIVALTAHAMAGERDRVQEAGMDDYLTKPAQESTLARMLVRHVGSELENRNSTSSLAPRDEPVSEVGILSADVVRSERLVALFQKSFPEQVQSLENAIVSESFAEAAALAHKLKGTLGAFGALQAHRVAVELDAAAKAKDWPLCHELLVRLDVEGASIEEELARMR